MGLDRDYAGVVIHGLCWDSIRVVLGVMKGLC